MRRQYSNMKVVSRCMKKITTVGINYTLSYMAAQVECGTELYRHYVREAMESVGSLFRAVPVLEQQLMQQYEFQGM